LIKSFEGKTWDFVVFGVNLSGVFSEN